MVTAKATPDSKDDNASRSAMRFVLLIGVLSLFADFTYEGSRSILGPYLASLQASATVVGIVMGLGELLGYGLRLVSGRLADSTGRFWTITIIGYAVQMAAVPALAFTQSWPAAAVLIVLERIGKAIRNPPRDVMLSHAGQRIGGYGWAFGIHEALDQLGAMFGPLLMAAVLARHGDYHLAFAVLLVPALINLLFVGIARWQFPRPQDMETQAPEAEVANADAKLPRIFWVYLAGAALVAAGFADYALIGFHFARGSDVSTHWIPLFYAIAMAVSGGSSLLFGRLFDRYGFKLLIGLTAVAVLYAPLAFLGGFGVALLGVALWGMGMGVHESIIPAAVTPMVPQARRASAFGLFTAGYGVFWFLGSAAIGFLYDHSITWAIVFCVVTQSAAIPFFIWVAARQPAQRAPHDQPAKEKAP